jgi:tetratricopeptide (TPR) repeat protein
MPGALHYGGYLLEQGDFEKFLAYQQRAVELDRYSLMYRHNLAIVYLKLHRLSDAERELKQAATIHPSMMDSLALDFARLRILQGRAKEVLELLPKLEDRSDQVALRAMAMSDLGDVAKGKTPLAELTKIPGAYAPLRQGEAEAYINQLDTTAATLAAMHEAARAGPEALWLANEAIHESKFSPFLVSGNKSARKAEKKVAALY